MLNGDIPERPLVLVAGNFLKLGLQADLLAVLAEMHEGGVEVVGRAGGEVQFRQVGIVGLFVHQSPGVLEGIDEALVAAVQRNGCRMQTLVHGRIVLLAPQQIARAGGKGSHAGKLLRVVEGVHAGAAAAHGQAGDEVVLALVGCREPVVHQRHQLIGEEIEHVVADAEIRPVGVVGVQGAGHDHDQVALAGIQFNIALADPVGAVAEGTVQQPQNLIFLTGTVELRRSHGAGLVRQDNGNVGVALQAFAFEIEHHQRHVDPSRLYLF